MHDMTKFYINGEWVEPVIPYKMEFHNPSSDEVCGYMGLGSVADVDKAIIAAINAFSTFSTTTKKDK